MTPERWREVTQIYGAVLSRAPERRAAAVEELCGTDQELRREIESLLESQGSASLLDRPAVDHGSVLQMVVPIGSQIGVFRIESLLGVGGMGEVYRARDTKLNRDVAIKILPPAFASDPDRLARFKREAQVLASLNHPNIAAIYGFEDSGSVHALVLELVEGDTLTDLLARPKGRALPKSGTSVGDGLQTVPRVATGLLLDEALAIARQIADALEAAHEQGIIHRDLKPANIKVRQDGTVKVLDFGLAKLIDPVGAGLQTGPNVTQSPTITTPAMTAAGMILGTAAYMSPEQAKGKPADKRSDIWAFGCVLYEMLTGKRAFEGEDVSDTLASILRSEPNWSALSPNTPPSIRRLLRRALEKDIRARLPHIGVARIEIDEARSQPTEATTAIAIPPASRRTERVLWGLVLAVVALIATGATIRTLRPTTPAPETRLDIATTPTTDPVSLAISPDGRKVAYVANVDNRPRLWIRELNATEARPLAKTEDAAFPFWSPDGQSIGFFADGRLIRIDLNGGSVRPIAPASLGRGGAWSPDGTIIFAPTALTGLLRTSANGDPVTQLTTVDVAAGQSSHSFPSFLPDGKHFLYYTAAPPAVSGVYLASLDAPAGRRLVEADAAARYDGGGHLLFVRQGTLYAQSFDASNGSLSGVAIPVAENVAVLGGSANVAALSVANGTIVYRTGSAGGIQQFVSLDRSGKPTEPPRAPDHDFPQNPSLSADGRRIVMSRLQYGNGDIWLLDLTRPGPPTRVTSDPTPETYARWSPDNDHVVFSRGPDLVIRSISGRTEEHLINRATVGPDVGGPSSGVTATDWSSDGRYILLRINKPATSGLDLVALDLKNDHKLMPVAQTIANEREGQFSPDVKWVAYQSNESGRYEIYVQRFPEGTNKTPVSTDGGSQVRWKGDGSELYYVALDGRMMVVRLTKASNGGLDPGIPEPLFMTHIGPAVPAGFQQQYVVSPNGTFIMNNIIDETSTTPITVLLNWHHDP